MKLVSFGAGGRERPGVLIDEMVIPLDPVLARRGLFGDMRVVLEHFASLQPEIADLAMNGDGAIPAAEVRLGAPVPIPGQIIAVGANYRSHLHEMDAAAPLPSQPVIFAKPLSSVGGPTDAIVRPPETTMLDYECELAVVIGRTGRRIRR